MSKENLYNQIIKEIKEHKDCGKRNPVEIGMECGYEQGDIINALSLMSAEKDEEKKEHFILNNGDVIEINLVNRKVKKIDKIYDASKAKVNYGILAWQDENNDKKLLWENLYNHEKGEFLLKETKSSEGFMLGLGGFRSRIDNFFVLKDEIIIESSEKIYEVKYSGEIKEHRIEYDGIYVVVENEKYICMVSNYRVYVPNKKSGKLEKIRNYSADDNKTICGLECDGGEIYYHIYDTSGFSNYYRKYTIENNSVNEDEYLSGKFYDSLPIGFAPMAIELINTKNYKLHKNGIYKKGVSKAVWGSSENLQFINQGKALYDEDIILGITGGFRGNKEPGVTWFDLNKRTSPVLLPVEY